MTVSQTLKLYEIANKYFKNEVDSKAFVDEIESAVDNKFHRETDRLASRLDMSELKGELKQDIKTLEVKIEQGFKDQLKWLIILMLGFASLIITVIKLL